MDYIILIVLAFWLGANYASNVIRAQLHNLAKQKGIKIVNDPAVEEKEVPILSVEKHGNLLYLFDMKSNNFMCQGSSFDELAHKLREYHKIVFAVVKHNDQHVWFIDGKVGTNQHEG